MGKKVKQFAVALMVGALLALAGCAPQVKPVPSAFDDFERADMSGYACMEDYEGETMFARVTVADITEKMKAGETFAVYAGFQECPWCNVALPQLNDVALEAEHVVGYLDTRANPAWNSNMDIDDYDEFVELFGDALSLDEEGKKHLYVPHVFFVKDGTLVFDHAGTVSDQESPSDELTDAQKAKLRRYFEQGFVALV